MRVYLESLGCRLNYAEMASLGRQLSGAGYHVVSSAVEADVCVLNSCAVTGEAARKSRQLARQLARSNPAARLIVTGCYATLEGETVAASPNVYLVVGNSQKDRLLGVIEGLKAELPESVWGGMPPYGGGSARATGSALDGPSLMPAETAAGRTRAFVKVQDGCRNRCTFCIVTVARGQERSRAPQEVVAEIRELQRLGYQEAVLTGVHLGGYGSDLGVDLSDLVSAVLAGTTMPRVRLSSLEPFDLKADFFRLWTSSDGRLMPHLHLPAQSGCDSILRRMARRNRVADYEALVAEARAQIPGLMVTTDLIVGFPGETEAEFAETVAFARRLKFAHVHIFPYSARAGTAAARMSGQIPEFERKRRSHILGDVDSELGRAARASLLGQTRSVLWEASLAVGQAGRVTWEGLTDNYLRLQTTVPEHINLHNRVLPARLTHVVDGELWGEVAPERREWS